jgi:hypothetical protein
MKSEGSFLCSQEPDTDLYPEPDEPSSHILPISLTPTLILPPKCAYVFLVAPFLQVFGQLSSIKLSSLPCVLQALIISSSLS